MAGLSVAIAPAYSASLVVFPEATQLDSDPIDDVVASIGRNGLILNFKLDTAGLPGNLASIVFTGLRDESELGRPTGLVQTPESIAQLGRLRLVRDPANAAGEVFFRSTLQGGTGVAPNTILDLFTVSNSILALVNDGLPDFRFFAVESAFTTDGTDVTNLFTVNTNFDVQAAVPEPASVLGLLAFGAFGATVKRNKKQASAKKAEA